MGSFDFDQCGHVYHLVHLVWSDVHVTPLPLWFSGLPLPKLLVNHRLSHHHLRLFGDLRTSKVESDLSQLWKRPPSNFWPLLLHFYWILDLENSLWISQCKCPQQHQNECSILSVSNMSELLANVPQSRNWNPSRKYARLSQRSKPQQSIVLNYVFCT